MGLSLGFVVFLVLEKKGPKSLDIVYKKQVCEPFWTFLGLLALLNPKMWLNWYFVGSRMRLSHLLQERRAQQERRAGEHLPGEEGTLQLPEVNRICCMKKKLQNTLERWFLQYFFWDFPSHPWGKILKMLTNMFFQMGFSTSN